MTPERSERNWRRLVAALLVVIATLLAAGIVFLAGLFSDWSGQHNVPTQSNVGAIALLVVGSLVAAWILFHGKGEGKAGTK
jgi:hypothetical protein